RWGLFWSALAAIVWVAVSAFVFVIWPLRVVFAPIVLALVIVYLLNPLVTRLQHRGLRRGVAVAVLYVAFIAVVGAALAFLIPLIARQIAGLIDRLPTYIEDA